MMQMAPLEGSLYNDNTPARYDSVRGCFCVESHRVWWMLARPPRSGSIGYRYPMGKPHNFR